MDQRLTHVEHAEPIAAAGRPRRTRGVVAVAACVVLMAGALVGASRLLTDDGRAPSSAPSGGAAVVDGTVEVSGSGVGTHPFGSEDDEVLADVTALLGEPDLTTRPQRYERIPGSDGWFEDGDDPISPHWRYRVTASTCWDALCLVLGGDAVDSLRLRGWELTHYPGTSGADVRDREQPGVRLAGSGIELGDSWKQLHAAYPATTIKGAEGASLAVDDTPWEGVFDGAGEWRLSGSWDYTRPRHAPPGAVVTRLSGGEGPEPGCC
jgi:hypothetical protein